MYGQLFPTALAAMVALLLIGCSGSRPAAPVDPADLPRSEVESQRNRRLEELTRTPARDPSTRLPTRDYRIGPDDLLEITVFDAPELSRSVRVSERGEISLPLVGEVPAAGSTARELERSLEEKLRGDYLVDPHVTVQVTEVQSHPISVLGAVNQPGVFQVRGTRTLLEILALAGGLSEDAGESVIVMRAGVPGRQEGIGRDAEEELAAEEVELNHLLESGDPRYNLPIYPGDIVKVKRADVIYVVGEVNQPGAFSLTNKDRLTVLQAVALGKGLRPTAAKGRVVIIRTTETGERVEIPVDVGDVLAGTAEDTPLQPKDIVFVPNSSARSIARGFVDALVRMVTLRGIF